MSELTRKIARMPIIGVIALRAYRARIALGYYRAPLSNLLRWIFKSRETSNFTYDLQDINRRYLAALIAHVVGTTSGDIMAYFEEIEGDSGLKRHIADATKRSDWGFMADTEVRFARRIGWYAFARALKPRIIVETGVDKGLGSCVLTAALDRNSREGHGGQYFGLDINPKAGYLLSDRYAGCGRISAQDRLRDRSLYQRQRSFRRLRGFGIQSGGEQAIPARGRSVGQRARDGQAARVLPGDGSAFPVLPGKAVQSLVSRREHRHQLQSRCAMTQRLPGIDAACMARPASQYMAPGLVTGAKATFSTLA
jgi:hypothetical protein